MKWKLGEEVIENKLSDLSEYVVMVRKDYIKELEDHNIPYTSFSEEAKKCYFIKDGSGSKPKKFISDVEVIKEKHRNGSSYRKLAKEYKCSTRTIYLILNDKY